MREEKETDVQEWKETLRCIIVTAVVLTLLNIFIIINAFIPSLSMLPTMEKGDRLIGSRIAYNIGDPQRYDIAIFHYPDNEKEYYIKRVIGLPGDRVELKDGVIFVNGKATDESFCREEKSTEAGYMKFPFTVPDGHYFMLGDNRKNSSDSRYWKTHFVERDEIVAKAVFRYWPVTRISVIRGGGKQTQE